MSFFRSWFRLGTCVLLAIAGLRLTAQESLTPPTPFAGTAEAPAGGRMLAIASAERALHMGFSSIAAEIFQQLLEDQELSGTVRNRVIVQLVTALLEDNRVPAAQQALQKFVGLPTPSYRLRVALVATRTRDYEAARREFEAFTAEDLPAEDRSWYYFVEGVLADVARDFNRSAAFYQQAIDAASSNAQRARFSLARSQLRLMLGEFNESQVATLRQTLERNAGRSAGYAAVSQLAVALNGIGRRGEAVSLLQDQLQMLPREERSAADEWRLLLGLIAGAEDGPGRNALRTLLTNAADHDKQRVALHLLANASRAAGRRDDFRAKLNELIGAPTTHPLLEDLLLFRAQTALSIGEFATAETDANRLLSEFPGSQLKAAALGVLTSSAWQQARYRNAALQATNARAELPAGETRVALGVLVAEAYFRAGDFRSAADAYGAAVEEAPLGVSLGGLVFQRILSEIEARRLDQAQEHLNRFTTDARLDVVNRWRAEWNLARALQAAGQTRQAYERVNRLLSEPASAQREPELRARMAWLQARLSFEAGEPARTLTLAQALKEVLEPLDPALRSNLASTLMLLEAEANFALNAPERTAAALDLLRKLRADYPGTDAAVYSYIVEADDYARKNQFVDAQNLLVKLADDFRDNPYAPYALYQAALYAERRGQNAYYEEAYKLLESLIRFYPRSALLFDARLKQGDLLRKLNDYGAAQQIYELLVNEFSQHQDIFAAQLALADCHAAQAATDASHQESATTIYERLLDLPTAPVDLRVEAGFKYGLSLARRGLAARAYSVWWPRVIDPFLLDAANAAKLGAKGPYWMSRTLLELGGVLEQQSKLDQARQAYDLIISKGLPGAALAKERLARFQQPLAGTTP